VPFIITALLALVSVIPTWFKFKLPEGEDPEAGAKTSEITPAPEPGSPSD
jgi:hypothetical protein